jgi:tetratricopeptide (TPR) repeat protein
MPYRSSHSLFFLFLAFTLSLHSQSIADARRSGSNMDNMSRIRTIVGAVYTSDGVPVAGAWVTVRNLQSGEVVFTGQSASDGGFEVAVLANSMFEVVARLGNAEDRAVEEGETSMSLRMTLPLSSARPQGDKVSVSDLKAPRKAQEALEKATKALRANDLAKARKELEEAVKLYPDYPAALPLLAVARSHDDPAGALLLAQRATQLSPDSAFARAIFGGLLNDSGQSANALEEAEAAIKFAPTLWQGHFERARSLAALGRLQEALPSAIRADELARGQVVSVRVARSRLLAALGRQQEAQDQLNAFIQNSPDRASRERAAAEKVTIQSLMKK